MPENLENAPAQLSSQLRHYMDWFLYDRDLLHKRVTINENTDTKCVNAGIE